MPSQQQIADLEYAALWAHEDRLELRYPQGGKRIFGLSIQELVNVLKEELQEERVYEPVEGFKITFWRAAYEPQDALIQLDIGPIRSWLYRSKLLEALQTYLKITPSEP